MSHLGAGLPQKPGTRPPLPGVWLVGMGEGEWGRGEGQAPQFLPGFLLSFDYFLGMGVQTLPILLAGMGVNAETL